MNYVVPPILITRRIYACIIKVSLKSYPFKVGTVTSVSCMQLLRSINSEDGEVTSSLVEDVASPIDSVPRHDKRSSFIPSWGNSMEKNFWIDISCIPTGLFSACVIICSKVEKRAFTKEEKGRMFDIEGRDYETCTLQQEPTLGGSCSRSTKSRGTSKLKLDLTYSESPFTWIRYIISSITITFRCSKMGDCCIYWYSK